MQDIKFYDPYQLKVDLSLVCDLSQEGVSYHGNYLLDPNVRSKIVSIGPGVITISPRSQSFIVYGTMFGPINYDVEYGAPVGTFPTPDITNGIQFYVYRSAIRYMIGNAELFKYQTEVRAPGSSPSYYNAFYAQVDGTPILDIGDYPSMYGLRRIMVDGGRLYAIEAPPVYRPEYRPPLYVYTDLLNTYLSGFALGPYIAASNATPQVHPGTINIYIDKPVDIKSIGWFDPGSHSRTALYFFFFDNPCYRRIPACSSEIPTQHLSVASLGKTFKIKQATYLYEESPGRSTKGLICPSISISGDNGAPAGQELIVLESRMDFANDSYYDTQGRRYDISLRDNITIPAMPMLGKGHGSYEIQIVEENEEDEEGEEGGEEGGEDGGEEEGGEEGGEDDGEEEDEGANRTWLITGQDEEAILFDGVLFCIDNMEFHVIREGGGSPTVLGPSAYFNRACMDGSSLVYSPQYGTYNVSVSASCPEGYWNGLHKNIHISANATLAAMRQGGFVMPTKFWLWSKGICTYIFGELVCINSPEPDPTWIYAQLTFTPDQVEYYCPGLVISRLNDMLAQGINESRMRARQRYANWEALYLSIPDHITIALRSKLTTDPNFVVSLYKNHAGDFVACGVHNMSVDQLGNPWWPVSISKFSLIRAKYDQNCSGVVFILPTVWGAITVPANNLIGFEYDYATGSHVTVSG